MFLQPAFPLFRSSEEIRHWSWNDPPDPSRYQLLCCRTTHAYRR